jgi:hypothetical protein
MMFKTEGWISSLVECDICTYQWVAVFHEDTERLECPNCETVRHFEPIETDDNS